MTGVGVVVGGTANRGH